MDTSKENANLETPQGEERNYPTQNDPNQNPMLNNSWSQCY